MKNTKPLKPLLVTSLLILVAIAHHLLTRDARRSGIQQASLAGLAGDSNAASWGFAKSGAPKASPDETGTRVDRGGQAITSAEILSDSTKDQILNCVRNVSVLRGLGHANEFSSLSEFVEKGVRLDSGHEIESVTMYRNIHLLDRNGHKQRLHISPRSSGDQRQIVLEPRLFGVDDENLPVPMSLPIDMKDLDLKSLIEKFQSQSQIVLDEVSESQRWGDEVGAHILSRNGRIEKLEVFFNGGALVCATSSEVHCRCL